MSAVIRRVFAISVAVVWLSLSAASTVSAQDSWGGIIGYWADLVVVGQAEQIEPGRNINGCQETAITVRIEQVLDAYADHPAAGEPVVIEVRGDCTFGSIGWGTDIPPGRAIYVLQNKGYEMRRVQTAAPLAQTALEQKYWGLPGGLPIPFDDGGRVGLLGESGTFLDQYKGSSFSQLVSGVAELDWQMPKPPPEEVTSVGLSLEHLAGAFLLAALLGVFVVLVTIVLARRYFNNLNRVLAVALAALVAVAIAVFAPLPLIPLVRDLDFAANRPGWEAAIAHIRSNQAPGAEGDANGAQYRVYEGGQVMFFESRFGWGIGPDPYCGFEYASLPELIDPDPGGSGHGAVESLGGSWYWLCAA